MSTTPEDESPSSPVAVSVPSAAADVTAVTVASVTRRVPPPCWTDEEALALVNAYKEKWFALHRGNLRAADWEDVAAAVSVSSSGEGSAKTAIQCRHKIEKLRKRYRAEKQRCFNRPGKFSSSWDLFPVLDAMGFAPPTPASLESCDHDVDLDDENNGSHAGGLRVKSKQLGKYGVLSDSARDLGDGFGYRSRAKTQMKLSGGFKGEFDSDHDSGGRFGSKRKYSRNFRPSVDLDGDSDDDDDEIMLQPKVMRVKHHSKPPAAGFSHGSGGFPVKSFGDRNFPSPVFKPKKYRETPKDEYDDEMHDRSGRREGYNQRNQNSRSRVDANGSHQNGYGASSSRLGYGENNEPIIEEVVSSIKMLTEMFVRVEKSKMEMMREMGKARMEMELKHSQMMLDSQQQIVDALAEVFTEKKNNNDGNPI